ncbi:crotonase/enoyl-CoA hydratase family protein [Flagellatimonas centrodinii]|uniref:crotonase/enoyl-CoA hydratase family protein n=1 Tax=Flagellatimonas centrodinii TaxID=2806210 RepID=UPI001FF8FDE2|nr:crotonase/enoyl-CoA hydratase family protein [Flagellatimonas centrodinii]ULQ46452.1 crotonase/enoyl-CoA hydratase family protein [Flagellatimonas centrodinii]
MSTVNYLDRVRVETDADGVATVSLTRADKHNGFDLDMMDALIRAARALRRQRGLRAVILRGDGPSFCAGLDFKAVLSQRRRALLAFTQLWWPFRNRFQAVNLLWRELPVPVVAAIRGNCFGAGIQLAAGADLRFATADARLSIMESKWGLIPDMGATVTLRHLLRRDVVMDLVMTGRVVGGQEACALGLVTAVADDPEAAARAWIDQVLTRSPDAVAAGKRLFDAAWDDSAAAGLGAERRWQRRLMGGANQRASVARHLRGQEQPFAPTRIR